MSSNNRNRKRKEERAKKKHSGRPKQASPPPFFPLFSLASFLHWAESGLAHSADQGERALWLSSSCRSCTETARHERHLFPSSSHQFERFFLLDFNTRVTHDLMGNSFREFTSHFQAFNIQTDVVNRMPSVGIRLPISLLIPYKNNPIASLCVSYPSPPLT